MGITVEVEAKAKELAIQKLIADLKTDSSRLSTVFISHLGTFPDKVEKHEEPVIIYFFDDFPALITFSAR
jgi:hypothetical protein